MLVWPSGPTEPAQNGAYYAVGSGGGYTVTSAVIYEDYISLFWEDKTNETAGYGKVGGHVKKAYSTDNTWYIAAITAEQNALNVPYEYNGKLAKLRYNGITKQRKSNKKSTSHFFVKWIFLLIHAYICFFLIYLDIFQRVEHIKILL